LGWWQCRAPAAQHCDQDPGITGDHPTIAGRHARRSAGHPVECSGGVRRVRRNRGLPGRDSRLAQRGDWRSTPDGLPYVVAAPATAAGFIFGSPLRAGHPTNPDNKILWVVRTPRDGASLQITVRPVASAAPVLHEEVPANSGPGEIYPDGVDVPTAGCWHFTLRWRTGHAELDLWYVAARP
jgi:hypothetical protein